MPSTRPARCSPRPRRCGTRSHWGGETQALIFDPRSGKVRAINALGVAPTRRDAGVLPLARPARAARVRAARRRDAGHAGRAARHAGRVRHAEPWPRCWSRRMQMAAGYPMEQTQTREHRGEQRAASRGGTRRAACCCRTTIRSRPQAVGRAVAGRDLQAAGAARDADKLVEAERAALAAGQEPQASDPRRIRSVLSRRHRRARSLPRRKPPAA